MREQNPYLLTQTQKCVSRSLQQFNVRGNDILVIILQGQIAKLYIHYSMCYYWWTSGNNMEVVIKHFVCKSFTVVLRTEKMPLYLDKKNCPPYILPLLCAHSYLREILKPYDFLTFYWHCTASWYRINLAVTYCKVPLLWVNTT